MVARDADFALGVNLDKEQVFKVVNAYANLAYLFGADEKGIRVMKEEIAALREDPFREAPDGVRTFLEKTGLRDAELRWAVMSLEDFEIVDGKPQLGGLSLAVAGTIDLNRVISVLRREDDCDAVFEESRLEGETAWHVVPENPRTFREMREVHVDPYVTSLDGRLVLAATSRETLAKQIRRYRRGQESGDALGGFSAAEGELMRLHLSSIGGLVRKYVPRTDLRKVTQIVPNGDEIILGLEALDVDINVLSIGMLSDSVRLGTASEADAASLRMLAKTGMMFLRAQVDEESKMANLVKQVLGEIKVGGTGRQLEIRDGSFFAIVAGALLPAVSSALPAVSSTRLNANAMTLSIQGRKLIMGIIQANIDRPSSQGTVWPRTNVDGDSTDDIASHGSKSATDYFSALFDIEHYGTSEWDPNVDSDLLRFGVLGKNAVVGKTIRAAGLDWCIAANVTDETPDFMPVLISANFNPALLLNEWNGQTDGTRRLPIGPESGSEKSMFNDKAIVIVRKSGAAEVIKQTDLTYNKLYAGMSFDLTNMNPPLKYLTPTGVVGFGKGESSQSLERGRIGDVDDSSLTEAQKAQLDELHEALDDDSFRRVAKIAEKIQDQYRKGGDAAVPPYMREKAVEALSWFLPDSLADLIGFMADSNPEVLEDVMMNFTLGLSDAELGDRELAAIFKKIGPLIKDEDAIDAVLMRLENDMRNSVAVDTYKELFKTGSDAIKKRLVESMQNFTGKDDITAPEQLDAWLKENPDGKDDEASYGKSDKDDKSEKRR